MCVDDVAANCHVAGNRDAGSPACRGDTELSLREAFLLDDVANGFADAVTAFCCLADDVVQAARFVPEPVLAEPDPTGNRFACSAEERKLEVMDDTGTVQGNVRHEPAFDQIDDVLRESQLDNMSAHHQYHWTILFPSIRDACYEVRELEMFERFGRWRKQ